MAGHRHRRRHRHGPFTRSPDDRLIAGVGGGLAQRFGMDPTVVRLLLALSVLAGGAGLVGYVVAWLLFPLEGQSVSIGTRAVTDRRGILLTAALLPLLLVVMVVASAVRATFVTSVVWVVFLVAAGLLLVYRNAEEEERAWLRSAAEPFVDLGTRGMSSRRTLVVRIAGAVILLVGGLSLTVRGSTSTTLAALCGVAVMLAGIILLFGPWWLRLTRDLMAERQARIRAEERTEMAARVHDSVLQTLALIQRSADQPERVVHLARTQERELRSWLFERQPPGPGSTVTLSAALEEMAAEVEDVHHTAVEVVVVGDVVLDDDLAAVVAAAREATVNAATWSGAPAVSLYAEAEGRRVSVFVRDRGSGFDPDRVPVGHQGIATSIKGRMERVGGTATVRSAPGEGTEVALVLPRRSR